ncbi:hypothetical protein L6164_012397 [Bauhinia variegata]|uniref:Uncharacterized protein n=1 Tax=Bauhinia variegata TaxID=167791 RepID=A0ACB9P9Z6_BAUVA|nr:hypothetical protein L6164_012397 [Bauhinia variegata]
MSSIKTKNKELRKRSSFVERRIEKLEKLIEEVPTTFILGLRCCSRICLLFLSPKVLSVQLSLLLSKSTD